MYLNLEEIYSIQLDHTSRCNLLCPQCARTSSTGTVNPKLQMKDLTVTDYEKIFTPFIGRKINILHCGNYGDVIASPTFDETIEWCNVNGFNNITIMTNGSARKPEWWGNLAKYNPYVVFSVDGLDDTNHLYRVNSNFSKIADNMKAFTSSGGKARWDYLLFEHNIHQVACAQQLAKELGIHEFNIKNTSRFVMENGYISRIENKNKQVVIDIENNANKKDYDNILKEHKTFTDYTKITDITCKYKRDKRIYIDFNMRVWPCCWVGAPMMFEHATQQTHDLQKVIDKYGEDFNRLDMHGWDVLNHEFYQSYLEDSWNNPDTRLYTCGRTCGSKYEFSSGYGKNTERIKIT